MDLVLNLKKDLTELSDPERKKNLQRFFKTGKGEYGEGDVFLGVKVPDVRKVAKKYRKLPLNGITELLNSEIHEHRQVAIFILIDQYQKGKKADQKKIVEYYLKNTNRINNWDLVDSSAHKIVGDYYRDKTKDIFHKLSKSNNLWERRISVIGTFAYLPDGTFETSLTIAETLLHDPHDLIHKAVGWMLREIGKRDLPTLETFLNKHHKTMPRTMLRYSIEKLDKQKRQYYMKK